MYDDGHAPPHFHAIYADAEVLVAESLVRRMLRITAVESLTALIWDGPDPADPGARPPAFPEPRDPRAGVSSPQDPRSSGG